MELVELTFWSIEINHIGVFLFVFLKYDRATEFTVSGSPPMKAIHQRNKLGQEKIF